MQVQRYCKNNPSRYGAAMDAAIALGVGFVAGVRHAADPDHVLAIAQLSRPGTSALTASKTAISWGLGHSTTIMVLGSGFVATGAAMPEGAGAVAQLAVAVMLVVLAWRAPRPAHAAHVGRRAAVVGLVHGAAGAGGATVLALGAASTAPIALLSLALMCLGTMGAMVALTYGFVIGSARLTPRLLDVALRLSRLLAVGLAVVIAGSVLAPLFS